MIKRLSVLWRINKLILSEMLKCDMIYVTLRGDREVTPKVYMKYEVWELLIDKGHYYTHDDGEPMTAKFYDGDNDE